MELIGLLVVGAFVHAICEDPQGEVVFNWIVVIGIAIWVIGVLYALSL